MINTDRVLIFVLIVAIIVMGFSTYNLMRYVPIRTEVTYSEIDVYERIDQYKSEEFDTESNEDLWHVVAFDDGQTYNVQIEGHDVIAHGDGMIKQVVADTLDDDYRIKVLDNGSVSAITSDGQLHPVVAMTDSGAIPVVVTEQVGHILNLKAVRVDGEELGVKAIGYMDNTCHVKGFDLLDNELEGYIAGVHYIAHVKAICLH